MRRRWRRSGQMQWQATGRAKVMDHNEAHAYAALRLGNYLKRGIAQNRIRLTAFSPVVPIQSGPRSYRTLADTDGGCRVRVCVRRPFPPGFMVFLSNPH